MDRDAYSLHKSDLLLSLAARRSRTRRQQCCNPTVCRAATTKRAKI